MKHLYILLCTLFFYQATQAQDKFSGAWQGKLKVADKSEITLVFYLKEKNGKLSGKMDSPDQGQTGLSVSDIRTKGDSIFMKMNVIGMSFAGELTGNQIKGRYYQSSLYFPLELEKTNRPSQLLRPQTPVPPFDYKVTNVSYYNADRSVKFGGTLTMPNGAGPFPAILLVSGGGLQNRDNEVEGHKSFAVLADYLTRQGYAVLRVDDRGVDETEGSLVNVTTKELALDAETSLNYLMNRPEINKARTGILGRGEGGLIAAMIASARKDVHFIVSLAGPGVPVARMMGEQTASMFKNNGADKAFIDTYWDLYNGIIKAMNTSKDSSEARTKISKAISDWKNTVSPETIMNMGLVSPQADEGFVAAYMNIFNNKWLKTYYTMNPQPYIEKLSCKVLALNGEKDIEVVPSVNLDGFRKSLQKSPSKNYEVKELKGLNHYFQECHQCTTGEYAMLNETISPAAMKEISDWLNRNVK